jgi:hypothetical protein
MKGNSADFSTMYRPGRGKAACKVGSVAGKPEDADVYSYEAPF